jgi:hypothetical protein
MRKIIQLGIISLSIFLVLISFVYADVLVGPRVYFEPSGVNVSFRFYYNMTFDSVGVESTYITINNATVSITPSSGSLNITILNFTPSYKRWNESASSTGASTYHTIGNFTPSANFLFNKNSAYWQTLSSNSTGYINFTYSDGFSQVQFEAEALLTQVTLSSPSDGLWTNNTTINLRYTPLAYSAIINCSLWGNFSGSWDYNLTNATPIVNNSINNFSKSLTNGIYLWNVRCFDNSGNSTFAISNWTINIDTISPLISVSHSPTNPTTINNVIVQATASDTLSGLNSIRVYVDGQLKATCSSSPCSSPAQTYSVGTHNYSSNVTDNVGNYNNTSGNFTVTEYDGGGVSGGGSMGGGLGTTVNNTTNATRNATDFIPPANITNLQKTSNETDWIVWSWENPTDSDFHHVEVWLNGTFKTNILDPTSEYRIINVSPSTCYELEIRPLDNIGNKGNWVNDTVCTQALSEPSHPKLLDSFRSIVQNENLKIVALMGAGTLGTILGIKVVLRIRHTTSKYRKKQVWKIMRERQKKYGKIGKIKET